MDTIKTIIVLWLVFDAGFLAGLFWAGMTRQNDPESRLHRKGEITQREVPHYSKNAEPMRNHKNS